MECCKGPSSDPCYKITFDNILKEDVPLGVSIICYTDDTLVVTAEDDIPMFEWKVNTALEAMICWIELAGLSLATTNMEAVQFTHRCRFSYLSFHLKGEQIRFCTALKYLVLWFDRKLTFKEHAKWTAAKAEKVVASISWLMSNRGEQARLSVSFWQTLPRWSSYMERQSGLTSSTPDTTKEQRWFRFNGRLC